MGARETTNIGSRPLSSIVLSDGRSNAFMVMLQSLLI